MNQILIIITTEPQRDKAKKISKLLLENNFAACISLKDISSSYMWDGEIQSSSEVEITIKSTLENRESIIKILKDKSSYELPQIIFKEFYSDLEYFNWVRSNVI